MSRVILELALLRYYRSNVDPSGAALRLLAQYDAERRAEALHEAADALAPVYPSAAMRLRQLADGLGEKSSREADATPDFFQVGHTYADTNHGTDWKFRVDHIAIHPDSGERSALGWRHFRGEWEPYAYFEDDWDVQLHVGQADVTEGGDA